MSRRPKWLHVLTQSGLCIDSARFFRWLYSHDGMYRFCVRYLRMRFSPSILEDALLKGKDIEERASLFTFFLSRINIRHIFKTTGKARTVLADELILKLAGEFGKPSLLEVGVSDGSSSLELLSHREKFGTIHLTDRFPYFLIRRFPFGRIFMDADGCPLGVKFLFFYLSLASERCLNTSGCERLETINPLVTAQSGLTGIESFDMFTDRLDNPVDLIKCANILNSSYFLPEQVVQALENLSTSLNPGGYLVLSQNNEKYVGGEALMALHKKDGRFVLVADINEHDFAPLLREQFGSGQ